MRAGRSRVSTLPRKYAGPVWGTPSVLPDLVGLMADCDIASANLAQALTFKCFPRTAVRMVIQYRTPIVWTRQFGSHGLALSDHRHFVTRHQSGVALVQPRGPMGAICLHIKPAVAVRLLGERLRCFLDATVGLEEIFGAGQVSLLEERVSEARTSAERFACVEGFLAANLRARNIYTMECRAAAMLQQNPQLRVRRLAARLGVSERHLSRRFQAMFGVSPKQFARTARIEGVLSARAQGAAWADIAQAAGFTDQAHMIKDFTDIIGVPPAQLAITAKDVDHLRLISSTVR